MAKCRLCKSKTDNPVIKGIYKFCSLDHSIEFTIGQMNKQRERNIKKAKQVAVKKVKVQKKKDKHRLKELKSRGDWYRELQKVVNYYVKHIKENNGPCRTCGTHNPSIKYDAGHYIAVGHNMDLRFELTNIHIQCSVKCNQFGRGMPVEYGEFIKKEYGEGHYHWLNTSYLCHKPHPTLKEQFPIWQDIEAEIKRYRLLIKGATA